MNKEEIRKFRGKVLTLEEDIKYLDELNAVEKALETSKTKEEFAETLRRELMYYFWSKAEWELVIELDEDNHIFLSPYPLLNEGFLRLFSGRC